MNEVAVSDARNRLADVIEESLRSGEPISVTRQGKKIAVILESDAFDRLVDAADDAEDRRDLEAARVDDDYVLWGEAKAALGHQRQIPISSRFFTTVGDYLLLERPTDAETDRLFVVLKGQQR